MKSTVLELNTRASSVAVQGDEVVITLADGRRVTFPWAANHRLREASMDQRANVVLICGGTGLSWPDLNEDLSLLGIIEGRFGDNRSA